MADMNVLAAGWLAPLGGEARLSHAYPDDFSRLPAVCWQETGNEPAAYADDGAYMDAVAVQVDVWAEGPEQAGALAGRADALMAAQGMRRTYRADAPDPSGLAHKVMAYRGALAAP